jgi:hypothetical protein
MVVDTSVIFLQPYCCCHDYCIWLYYRDGTSIILSDDVGQLYILNTGQGESQKDAKYDQVCYK